MKVLIACEEFQTVCTAFRERGHEAYSCDIQEPSGGHPEWHILGDALEAIKGGLITTMDGRTHDVGRWCLLIAHPPCTHLAASGERWFAEGRKPLYLRYQAASFFLQLLTANSDRIAIENPVGKMSTLYRKPDCIIQPWQFALSDSENTLKTTCLWLINLPKLEPVHTARPEIKWHDCVDRDGKNEGRHSGITIPDAKEKMGVHRQQAKPSPVSPKLWPNSGGFSKGVEIDPVKPGSGRKG